MTDLTHLHVHSYYSLMDGLNTPRELLEAAKDQGQTALAITDHGTMSGHREFQKHAAEMGIKPILGLEAYISTTSRFDRRPVKKRDDNTSLYSHIIVLAKDRDGYKNLNRLSEIAWTEGFYSKPRIDLEVLEEHGEGLIVLSGCMGGIIAKAIEREDFDEAERLTKSLHETFGSDFFMEVQAHNPESLNSHLLSLADKYGIRPVATSDAHYAKKEDAWIEEAMLILSTSPKSAKEVTYAGGKSKTEVFERLNYLYPDRPISFEGLNLYIQSLSELQEDFAANGVTRTDIFENTAVVAESIGEYDYATGLDLLPRPPKRQNPHALLRTRVMDGLKAKGLGHLEEYKRRVEEELEVIIDKDFSVYFLILKDAVDWARSQDIFVGPGRGSGAGSLVNYALGLTGIDPIEHNLLFFRFIDPERDDFPDIDTDFEDARRDEVKEYIRRKYGHVASIATYGTFAGKSCIRDASRVFMVPLADVNKALKGADYPTTVNFFDEWAKNPNGQEFAKKYPEVMELAHYLHGRIRTQGMHAGGLVVSANPISEYAPIQTGAHPRDKTKPRMPLVALDMKKAEDLGLVKYDLLGLNALTVIHETLKQIKIRHGFTPDLEGLERDDQNIYEMLSAGHTKGVFQCEQTPYTNLLVSMGGISNFGELAATNAIVRPGVANSSAGKEFLARRGVNAIPFEDATFLLTGGEPKSFEYIHPIMEPFTKETYGTIIYQEQVMQCMMYLAGMDGRTANKVRKIIGKKLDVKLFEQYEKEFVEGASKHVPEHVAKSLWRDFEAHAGYSFNKSHAVAYSYLSYWTAWLKYYYPLEFMLCTLRSEGDKDKRLEYLMEAKRLGIKVRLPHVNRSDVNFSIGWDEGGDYIRMGLQNVKGIADKTAHSLIKHRPYRDYKHLLQVMDEKGSGVSTGVVGALNKIGGAQFDDNPLRGDERDHFYEYLAIPAFEVKGLDPRIAAQIRPLSDYTDTEAFLVMAMVTNITRKPGWARLDLVDETGKAGVFADEQTPIEPGRMYVCLVAGNRLARYMTPEDISEGSRRGFVKFLAAATLRDVPEGLWKVVSWSTRVTKAGNKMAHVVLADRDKNLVPAMVFPQQYQRAFTRLAEGQIVDVNLAETDDGNIYIRSVK